MYKEDRRPDASVKLPRFADRVASSVIKSFRFDMADGRLCRRSIKHRPPELTPYGARNARQILSARGIAPSHDRPAVHDLWPRCERQRALARRDAPGRNRRPAVELRRQRRTPQPGRPCRAGSRPGAAHDHPTRAGRASSGCAHRRIRHRARGRTSCGAPRPVVGFSPRRGSRHARVDLRRRA